MRQVLKLKVLNLPLPSAWPDTQGINRSTALLPPLIYKQDKGK